MPTNRHERSEIEAFLDDEFRQVWAADRATGDPRYLPEGQAADLRAVAKAEWRCPVPGCEVEITTVGGTSRRPFLCLPEGVVGAGVFAGSEDQVNRPGYGVRQTRCGPLISKVTDVVTNNLRAPTPDVP